MSPAQRDSPLQPCRSSVPHRGSSTEQQLHATALSTRTMAATLSQCRAAAAAAALPVLQALACDGAAGAAGAWTAAPGGL